MVRPRRFPNLTREGTDVIVEITMAGAQQALSKPTRLVQGRERAATGCVKLACILSFVPNLRPALTHSSLNLQYDVGAGLRLLHKSGAIVTSPPTRDGLSPGASSVGTRARGMQRLLSLVKTQRATDGEGMKKEAKRGRRRKFEISNDHYSDMLGIAKNAQATW